MKSFASRPVALPSGRVTGVNEDPLFVDLIIVTGADPSFTLAKA